MNETDKIDKITINGIGEFDLYGKAATELLNKELVLYFRNYKKFNLKSIKEALEWYDRLNFIRKFSEDKFLEIMNMKDNELEDKFFELKKTNKDLLESFLLTYYLFFFFNNSINNDDILKVGGYIKLVQMISKTFPDDEAFDLATKVFKYYLFKSKNKCKSLKSFEEFEEIEDYKMKYIAAYVKAFSNFMTKPGLKKTPKNEQK